mgnify:CR=1 FL=1
MTEIKYIEDDLVGEKYKPGQSFHFRIAVPCVDLESFGLLVEHDGQNDARGKEAVNMDPKHNDPRNNGPKKNGDEKLL